MEQLTRHPLSALWGNIPEAEFAEMVEEFRRSPTRQIITLYEDKILDGWHRYRMCQEAGIEPFFNPLPEGQDPVTFVITRNAHRRHLTQMQYRAGILMSHGVRSWGEHGNKRGMESIPLPPSIQEHIAKHGGSRPGWMDALAIVKAGYGPQVMAGEPAQPFLDQIHETKAGKDDEVSADSQPDESLTPGSGDETDSPDEGTDDVHTGDDGGHRPATGDSETTQPDVGPEGDGPGVVTTPNTDDGPPAEKPPKPKGSTLTERLEAQVDALQMEVHEKAERIEGLERELREAKGQQSEYPHEREAVANEREAMISALRGSANQWQTKHNDERRRANWWERQARSLGWKREGQAEPPDPGEETGPPESPIYEGWDGQEHGEF